MSSLTFPRSIGLFINGLFNGNYDSPTGFANILSVLFCFFFQLSIIALVARVETIELAPASQIIMNATVAKTSVERTAKRVCLFV